MSPKKCHYGLQQSACTVEIMLVGSANIIGDEAFSENYECFTYYTTAQIVSIKAEVYECLLEVY